LKRPLQALKLSADIRQLYKPVQPTVKQSADNVTYSEFLPDLKKKGVPIKIDIRNEPWGDRHFAIEDPNGIGIDIVKYSPPQDK
jgi:uncharacterized glyoxalase superfamily protein PhnB